MQNTIRTIAFICLAGLAFQSRGQQGTTEKQQVNQLDEQGLKTGPWKVDYPNGRRHYEATFRAGKPFGEMRRYDKKGKLVARMDFDESGENSYTRMYHQNGKLAAEGWFRQKTKDSTWTYYSKYDGSLRLREPYSMGQLDGIATHYFQSGQVSEEVNWKAGKKEGPCLRYYPDGSLRLRTAYKNDSLEGPYMVFYADSTLQVEGRYQRNLAQGEWHYFNESGALLYSIQYDKGRARNQDAWLELMKDSLMRFEQLPPN